MKYRDLLRGAPEGYLQVLSLEHGIRRDLQGEQLSQAIAKRLSDRRYLSQISSELDPLSRHILHLLTATGSDTGVPIALARYKLNRLGQDYGRDTAQLINTLSRRGLVVTISAPQDALYYLVPEELREILEAGVDAEIHELLSPTPDGPVTYRDDGQAFLCDLVTFLAQIRLDPPKLTRAGNIYKRDENRLLERLEIRDDSGLPGSDEKSRIGWLQAFALGEGLIKEDNSRFVLTSGVQEWLQRPTQDHLFCFYTYWQDGHTYLYLQLAVRLLKKMAAEQWVSLSAFHKAMLQFSLEALWDTLLHTELFDRFFRPLIYFGFLRYATDDPSISLTQCGYQLLHGMSLECLEDTDYTIVVQPNYEVFAERRLSPQVRWNLESFASLEKSDQMMIFKISKESVYRALKVGMTVDSMLDFLKQYSRTAVPQNVDYALREWASRYGHLEFVDVLLLRCSDPSLAEEIKATPKFQHHVLGELGPTDLIIRRSGQHHFADQLEKLGYMPRPEIVHASECDDDAG